MRRRGSTRFEPYYKVQWYDGQAMAWRDIQKAHPDKASALAALPAEKEARIMRVAMDGRVPV